MNTRARFFWLLAVLLALAGCSREETPKDAPPVDAGAPASPAAQPPTAPGDGGAVDAGVVESEEARWQRRVKELVPQGWEVLGELPRSVPMKDAPKVQVRDLGPARSPVPGELERVYTDAKGVIRFASTLRYLYFYGPDGALKRRVKRKITDEVIREQMTRYFYTWFNWDGAFFWEVYAQGDTWKVSEGEIFRTRVFDRDGREVWDMEGAAHSLSPDGTRAIFDDLYMGGYTYQIRGQEAKELKGYGNSMSGACVLENGAVASSDSRIAFYDREFNKTAEKRILAMCRIVGCVGHKDLAFVYCQNPLPFVMRGAAIVYDHAGHELARAWMPPVGFDYFFYDPDSHYALVTTCSGNVMVFDCEDKRLQFALAPLVEVTSPAASAQDPSEFSARAITYRRGLVLLYSGQDTEESAGGEARVIGRDLNGQIVFSQESSHNDKHPILFSIGKDIIVKQKENFQKYRVGAEHE